MTMFMLMLMYILSLSHILSFFVTYYSIISRSSILVIIIITYNYITFTMPI